MSLAYVLGVHTEYLVKLRMNMFKIIGFYIEMIAPLSVYLVIDRLRAVGPPSHKVSCYYSNTSLRKVYCKVSVPTTHYLTISNYPKTHHLNTQQYYQGE